MANPTRKMIDPKKLQRLRKEVIIDAAENIRCRCERKERRLFENESI
jgi:hypothetical protein